MSDWIGSPRCDRRGPEETALIDGKDRLTVLAETSDPNADYSYDDVAVVLLDGVYYLVSTSGCSCPSPDETWGVDASGPDLASILPEPDEWRPWARQCVLDAMQDSEKT